MVNTLPDFPNKFYSRIVLFGERNENVCIGSARNTGVGIGEVDAGIRQTDVVNDTFQLLLRYFLADRGVNTADLPRNLFDTGPAL